MDKKEEREDALYCCQITMAAQILSMFINEQISGLLWNTKSVIGYIMGMYLK